MLKVVALTSTHDELARTVNHQVITDVCAAVSLLVDVRGAYTECQLQVPMALASEVALGVVAWPRAGPEDLFASCRLDANDSLVVSLRPHTAVYECPSGHFVDERGGCQYCHGAEGAACAPGTRLEGCPALAAGGRCVNCTEDADLVLAQQAHWVASTQKILHPAAQEVHCPGMCPYVVRQRSNFGVFDCVFTQACNFHTCSSKSSTMYRAGASREDISQRSCTCSYRKLCLTCSSTTWCTPPDSATPCRSTTRAFTVCLSSSASAVSILCMPMEECMFVHGLLLRVQNKEWLAGFGVLDVSNLKVRINICRTGVVNFFFGLAGGVPLQSAPEASLRPVCLALLQTVMGAV
jgi:hypothetical protein